MVVIKKFLIISVLSILLSGCSVQKTPVTPPVTSTTKESSFTLISTGDIGLVRYINYQIQQKKDPTYPFAKIAAYLKDADVTVTNLEGPLLKNCPLSVSGFNFCGQDTNVKGLVYGGIDVASVANNHSTNYGLNGLTETADVLKANNIKPFGLENQIEYLSVKGKKIAFVGFVELGSNWSGINNATKENVARLVAEAKKNADVVVTAFHWGIEYTTKPTSNQVELAHTAVDNGSDLVLGNHPHWIENSEIYKGIFITYAQGNTIFDQDWSQETKEGVLYKFEYKNGKFNKIEDKYTIIEQNVQPRFATPEETARIKSRL